MKKITLFSSAFLLLVMVSCGGAQDDKNIAEPYPTTDTTKKVENKNDMNHDTLNHQGH
ncbi:MAG: hypothetical protein JWO32_2310 [Bacteroidetes bacterium]|nr:hypothetical protein [Bacteroidota bacterium]